MVSGNRDGLYDGCVSCVRHHIDQLVSLLNTKDENKASIF
jgi:hypothetical protein